MAVNQIKSPASAKQTGMAGPQSNQIQPKSSSPSTFAAAQGSSIAKAPSSVAKGSRTAQTPAAQGTSTALAPSAGVTVASMDFSSGGMIEIPKGKTVSLPATGEIKASNITVRGVLTCTDVQSLGLTVDAIRVTEGGEFLCKLSEKSKLKMTFSGNIKAIEVDGGTLELAGTPRYSWTRLAATVEVGATTFSL
jgi:hypothetical protein